MSSVAVVINALRAKSLGKIVVDEILFFAILFQKDLRRLGISCESSARQNTKKERKKKKQQTNQTVVCCSYEWRCKGCFPKASHRKKTIPCSMQEKGPHYAIFPSKIKKNKTAKNVDPDKLTRHEPSYLDINWLQSIG